MIYLIDGKEVDLEVFNENLSYDIALTGSPDINPLIERDFIINERRYSVLDDVASNWQPYEEEFFLLKGIESTFEDPNAAIYRRDSGKLSLMYDMDDFVVFIPLKPHLFKYVRSGESFTVSYLLLKAEEHSEWK